MVAVLPYVVKVFATRPATLVAVAALPEHDPDEPVTLMPQVPEAPEPVREGA